MDEIPRISIDRRYLNNLLYHSDKIKKLFGVRLALEYAENYHNNNNSFKNLYDNIDLRDCDDYCKEKIVIPLECMSGVFVGLNAGERNNKQHAATSLDKEKRENDIASQVQVRKKKQIHSTG